MSNLTALGLELDYDEDDFTISPLNAIVIADGFDSEGDIRHVVMHTHGMGNVQAKGLVGLAEQWVNLNLMNDLIRSAYANSEEE